MNDASPTFDHKAFLRTLSEGPGVYRMLNAAGEVMYVGKAKSLRRRVGSYFTRASNRRIASMVSQIHAIEIIATHTEAEALLLENNLIKEHKPRYNVLLRDDKSYPYLFSVRRAVSAAGLSPRCETGEGSLFRPVSECRRSA